MTINQRSWLKVQWVFITHFHPVHVGFSYFWRYLYLNLACLGWCLIVCLCPINVKTAEPTRDQFNFYGNSNDPGIDANKKSSNWRINKNGQFQGNSWKLWLLIGKNVRKKKKFDINLQAFSPKTIYNITISAICQKILNPQKYQ